MGFLLGYRFVVFQGASAGCEKGGPKTQTQKHKRGRWLNPLKILRDSRAGFVVSMKSYSFMKSTILSCTFSLLAFVLLVAPAKGAPTPAQQAQIDTLKKTYPLTTCVVSEDELTSMGGKPIDYLYTQKNADGTETVRLVRFCCPDCISKFKKNPDKYLKVIDAAQTTKTPAPVAK